MEKLDFLKDKNRNLHHYSYGSGYLKNSDQWYSR